MALCPMVNASTGFSPSYLFGYEFRSPAVWEAPRIDFVLDEEMESLKERVIMIQSKMKDCKREI